MNGPGRFVAGQQRIAADRAMIQMVFPGGIELNFVLNFYFLQPPATSV